jgi:hypothetical protein
MNGKIVTTPVGTGKIVYELPNGSFVVEYPWGGGEIITAQDILSHFEIFPKGKGYAKKIISRSLLGGNVPK